MYVLGINLITPAISKMVVGVIIFIVINYE